MLDLHSTFCLKLIATLDKDKLAKRILSKKQKKKNTHMEHRKLN